MKLTLKRIKNLIKEELSKLNEGEVPLEVKEKIFAQMKKDKAVPKGQTIEDAEFWEVDKEHRGAVEHNGKYYYGEI